MKTSRTWITQIVGNAVRVLSVHPVAGMYQPSPLLQLHVHGVSKVALQGLLQLGPQRREGERGVEMNVVRIVHTVLVPFQVGEMAVVVPEIGVEKPRDIRTKNIWCKKKSIFIACCLSSTCGTVFFR